MDSKKLLKTILAAFAVIFVVDFMLHGILLKELYMQTAAVWRAEDQMKTMFAWMLAGQLGSALMYVLIFRKGYEGKGINEGIRFGIYLGAFMAAPNLGLYSVLPVPFKLVVMWMAGNFVQAIAVGITVSLLSR